MQGSRRNHTVNPIDTKIEPQIALIAENCSDSFFVVLSALKGRLPNVFSQSSWLTCLNPYAIESRMQENYEELKIFLKKCLISHLIKSYISVRENVYL